jgi:tight adherence protein B
VQQVALNYKDPWGTEFQKMVVETSLGATLEEVLSRLCRRVPNPDVDLFATCVLIQKETGGNMTELLANLSQTCRERFKLFRKISAITAQGKLTAVIICLVPFIIMAFMYLFMSEAVLEFLQNPIGWVILGAALIWMSIGAGVLWKLVQVDV